MQFPLTQRDGVLQETGVLLTPGDATCGSLDFHNCGGSHWNIINSYFQPLQLLTVRLKKRGIVRSRFHTRRVRESSGVTLTPGRRTSLLCDQLW